MTGTWPGAFARALAVSVWLLALAAVSIAGAVVWSQWRTNVAEFEADLDPRPRADLEEFPGPQDDVAARVARAEDGLAWVNRRFAITFGVCAAIGAGLIGAAAAVRRRRTARADGSRWRTWVLVPPLVAALVALAVLWLGAVLRGAIPG